MLWIAERKNLLHAAPNQRQRTMHELLPDLARQKCERALECAPAGLVVEVELIFVRQRRLGVAREEQALDPHAAALEPVRQRDRLRQQRIAVACRDEGWRKLRRHVI